VKGVSHALCGLAVVVVGSRLSPLAPTLVDVVLVGAVGMGAALLPDLDSDEATIRQVTRTARSQGCVGGLVSAIVTALGGHRGALTHSLLSWLVVSAGALLYFHGNMLSVAFSLGYLSHLVADALTIEGVPLLWPLVRRRLRLLPSLLAIRTGGWREYVVMVALWVFVVLLVWGKL
jgi:inner membrane protein